MYLRLGRKQHIDYKESGRTLLRDCSLHFNVELKEYILTSPSKNKESMF